MTVDLAPAPFRPAAKTAADVRIELIAGKSVVTQSRAGDPLKLLVPRQGNQSAWVIAVTYGGGLVAGDEVRLNINCLPHARGMLGTQSSTKIFRSTGAAVARQKVHATVAEGALLTILPDPVVCFAESRYIQRQRIDLAADASLVLLDSFTAGRVARGERWAMNAFDSATDIFIDGRRVMREAVRLDGVTPIANNAFGVGRFNAFATLTLLGPLCNPAASELIQAIHSRKLERRGRLMVTASPIVDGSLIRIAAEEIELANHTIRELLPFVGPLLGENPWSRKW